MEKKKNHISLLKEKEIANKKLRKNETKIFHEYNHNINNNKVKNDNSSIVFNPLKK